MGGGWVGEVRAPEGCEIDSRAGCMPLPVLSKYSAEHLEWAQGLEAHEKHTKRTLGVHEQD